MRKYVAGTDNEPLSGVEFKVTDGTGAAVGPDNGIYVTDRQGEFRIPNLEAGVNITVRETKAPDGGVEIIKLDGADKTKRLPSTTFEIRKQDGGLHPKRKIGAIFRAAG